MRERHSGEKIMIDGARGTSRLARRLARARAASVAPRRLRVPGLVDVLLVSDPAQIAWLDRQPAIVRRLDPGASPLHALLDRRTRLDLGFGGRLLPVFRARDDAERAARQAALRTRLDALGDAAGPELASIVRYLRGELPEGELGAVVQRWCGRLLHAGYASDDASYAAGARLAGWPSAAPLRTLVARITGRLARDKRVVAERAAHDPYVIHATSIGMENVTRTLRRLREAAADEGLGAEGFGALLHAVLVAPSAVLRGCTRSLQTPFLARPLTPRTLVVLRVARAFAHRGALDVAFQSESWTACPARHVV
ncbi:MAG: hypothetical protein ABW252_01185, partial [Polyangiales bacterium]